MDFGKYVLVLFFCALFTANCSRMLKRERRVIGGRPIDIRRVGFTLRLEFDEGSYYSVCSGALIKPEWVLTAAHCVTKKMTWHITVIGNTASQDSPTGIVRRVTRKKISPDFNAATYYADLALLKLDEPMYGRPIRTIDIDDVATVHGREKLDIFGWGHTDTHGLDLDILNWARVPSWPNDICGKIFRVSPLILDATRLCVGDTALLGPTIGDSGAPVIRNDKLVGVLSSGCHGVGIATRTYNFAKWINETIITASQLSIF